MAHNSELPTPEQTMYIYRYKRHQKIIPAVRIDWMQISQYYCTDRRMNLWFMISLLIENKPINAQCVQIQCNPPCNATKLLILFLLWEGEKKNLPPVHTMNTYGGRGGISPLILNSPSRWK
jgi:hypothetical protein